MKTSHLLCLMLSMLALACNADPALDAYLLNASNDIASANSDRPETTAQGTVASWVENAQFRFNARNNVHNDRQSQAYEVRIKPKAWGQREAEQNILKLRARQQNIHYQQQLNLALHKRYRNFLEYLQQHNQTRYLQQLAGLLTQQTALLQTQIQSSEFDAEKLLQTTLAEQNNTALLTLNQKRLTALQSALGLTVAQQAQPDSWPAPSDYISITEIQQQLDTLYPQSINLPSSPKIEDTRLNLQLLNAQQKLLKSKQQFGINLLSFEYRDQQNDEMEFMFGVNIPLGNKFNSAENGYQHSDAQSQLALNIAKLQQRLSDIKTKISWLQEEFQLTRQQIQQVQQHLQKGYGRLPQLNLNLQKEKLEYQNKNLLIQQKARLLYLSALALTGKLVQAPLRNWIQTGQPELAKP